ncbi:hypothetical protein [uncultured Microbacterium sp.]|uniref:hypothetical protein n=1 Tax=uncultured Microbacterium sp. TaxID=191216 RepID=UPI0025F5C993|nr:hypothetical protein [uncultured Microbacterium sp.]
MNEAERRLGLFDVSLIEGMNDSDLTDRLAELARMEHAQFHDDLSPKSFIRTTGYLANPPLDRARRAVEKEMKRRGIWRPADAQ